MDKFYQYLNDNDGGYLYRERALTDRSYKNIKHDLNDKDINFELATFGDALLKFILCDLFLDQGKQLTEKKATYEKDEILVKVIAQEYKLIPHIHKDEHDGHVSDYNYKPEETKNKKNPHKYIATAVEALLGAFYKDNQCNYEETKKVVENWIRLIDDTK